MKATLVVAFIVLTVLLTYLGLNKREARIDFDALEKENSKLMTAENEKSFENILKNLGNSTTLVKPEILVSADTERLSLSIRLLDTMKQYIYAGVLSERLAGIQSSSFRYHKAARFFLLATESGQNQLMLFKKAKTNLDKCLAIDKGNLDAKVDLAVSVFNINNMEPPLDKMALMRPASLLMQVVAADSNNIDAHYYLAKLAMESNQTEKAIVRFKKLVSLQPQNTEFYLELVKIYRMLGNETEAKAWEQKAQAIN